MPPRSAIDVAYDRVREIALRFPAADEKLSHGSPSFHVRGKMFLMFVGEAYGRGLAVWCKATLEEQRARVAGDPARFFVPPYVGAKGWIGVDVDPKTADWIDLSILVEDAWRSVAPPRVVRGEVVPERVVPAPTTRVTTDPRLARDALSRLKKVCDALPEVECEEESKHATFRVRKKVFAYFLDNHHGDGAIAVCIRGDKRQNARTIATDPKRFYLPQYIGPRGYLGVRLDAKRVDWSDVAQRVSASYRIVAPKRLLQDASSKRSAR
jgi:hypothetical protein